MSSRDSHGGKRCIVIGGSGVVGRAVCAELVSQGAEVGFTYLSNESAAGGLCEALGRCHCERLDVRAPEQIGVALDRLLDKLGGVDALVYSAGRGSTCDPPRFDALDDVTIEGWNDLLAINVAGAFFVCRHLVPSFGQGGGNIVLLGSIDGVKPVPAPVPYATSKAALRGLVSSLAKGLGEKNIRVNQVVPGVLSEGASHTMPQDLRAEYLKHSGLGRFGTPDEIAALVGWFALDNAYVTGQAIVSDGAL